MLNVTEMRINGVYMTYVNWSQSIVLGFIPAVMLMYFNTKIYLDIRYAAKLHEISNCQVLFCFFMGTWIKTHITGERNLLQILRSYTQAGPGRKVKQGQEHISQPGTKHSARYVLQTHELRLSFF